jgi:hypothetical protein
MKKNSEKYIFPLEDLVKPLQCNEGITYLCNSKKLVTGDAIEKFETNRHEHN